MMWFRIQPPRQLLGELIAVEERVSANATAGRLAVFLAPALQQRARLEVPPPSTVSQRESLCGEVITS